jgi:MFS family permease
VPDMLPKDYRSQGSGVMNLIGNTATIIGLVIMGALFSSHRILAYWLLSIIMIICLVILLLSVRETKDVDYQKQEKKLGLFDSVKGVFKENTKGLLVLLFSIFFTAMGYNAIETFITIYAEKVLGFDPNTGFYILAIFVVMSLILAIPAGLIGRRIGPLNACIISLIGLSIAVIPMTIISLLPSNYLMQEVLTIGLWNAPRFTWSSIVYLFLVLLLGICWIVLSINNMVVIWNMAPKGRTATFTGYFYLFHHLAHAISPNLAGGVFAVYQKINLSLGIAISGYKLLFLYSSICFIISLILIVFVKQIKSKELIQIKDTKEYIQQRVEKKDYPILLIPMLLFGVGLRKEKDLANLRQEQFMERKELRQQTKALKIKQRELRKRFFGEIDDLLELQLEEIKEHKQLLKETKRKQRKHKRELREKIMDTKVKEKIQKHHEEKKEE